jgi:hypothetical protein
VDEASEEAGTRASPGEDHAATDDGTENAAPPVAETADEEPQRMALDFDLPAAAEVVQADTDDATQTGRIVGSDAGPITGVEECAHAAADLVCSGADENAPANDQNPPTSTIEIEPRKDAAVEPVAPEPPAEALAAPLSAEPVGTAAAEADTPATVQSGDASESVAEPAAARTAESDVDASAESSSALAVQTPAVPAPKPVAKPSSLKPPSRPASTVGQKSALPKPKVYSAPAPASKIAKPAATRPLSAPGAAPAAAAPLTAPPGAAQQQKPAAPLKSILKKPPAPVAAPKAAVPPVPAGAKVATAALAPAATAPAAAAKKAPRPATPSKPRGPPPTATDSSATAAMEASSVVEAASAPAVSRSVRPPTPSKRRNPSASVPSTAAFGSSSPRPSSPFVPRAGAKVGFRSPLADATNYNRSPPTPSRQRVGSARGDIRHVPKSAHSVCRHRQFSRSSVPRARCWQLGCSSAVLRPPEWQWLRPLRRLPPSALRRW